MSLAARSTVHRRRPLAAAFVAVLLAALLTSVAARPVPPAAASASDESAFVAALNQVRAGVGLPALSVNAQLANLARSHADTMANAGEIFHADPISAGYSGPWAKLGENVGVGAGVQVLVDAFVASPGHYANIVDPTFSEVGVGVVWRDGALYTTHRFLQLPGTPPPTTTAAPPPTTAAPPPVPTAAPPSTTVAAPPSTTVAAPPSTTVAAPAVPAETTPTAPAPVPSTTIAPLAPPAVLPERLIEVVGLLELVGT